MWVVTVFDQNTYRMFEYQTKAEATNCLSRFSQTAMLSYTK
ncbi:hypothetical protein GCM10007425_00680 [Lysinibacillus alkalisoli]|uniref:Uncharacterized protein n=1 Tax=Lysinibacillus alkalisoli TaxID=1911548 RepID=A0A917D438_9BACI|nr:hypothetical protein GCM10007425_00680 [Lysinibacillus alkalisoli]